MTIELRTQKGVWEDNPSVLSGFAGHTISAMTLPAFQTLQGAKHRGRPILADSYKNGSTYLWRYVADMGQYVIDPHSVVGYEKCVWSENGRLMGFLTVLDTAYSQLGRMREDTRQIGLGMVMMRGHDHQPTSRQAIRYAFNQNGYTAVSVQLHIPAEPALTKVWDVLGLDIIAPLSHINDDGRYAELRVSEEQVSAMQVQHFARYMEVSSI